MSVERDHHGFDRKLRKYPLELPRLILKTIKVEIAARRRR
jgi:hypothetical protein